MTAPGPPAEVPGMEARVAAVDWSRTPLGPAGSWPQSLRTALSICLSSRFPMLVWWGPELIQFYNDAYLPAMGNKDPAALGQPAAQTWAEAWGDLGPLAGQVLAGGGATYSQDQVLLLERHGYTEESYWTFSYSPIRDESGGVGGIFIAVTDTTTRVLGERRLRALRDLGEFSTSSTGTVEEACRATVTVLARHRSSVPFALAQLRGADGELRLVASSGLVPDGPAAGGVLPAPAQDAVARVLAGRPGEVVGGLAGAGLEPSPVGAAIPDDAVVLPITVSAEEEPAGVLVLGVNPYRDLDADYRGFFDLVAGHVSTAVTDARAYQDERRRAESLAELDRAKTDFFSNVSHEFRTPLTLIMGPVAELQSSPVVSADPALREELDVIERNALRLGKLVNTLLDFSRIQAGRLEARFEPVDLAEATAELAAVFRSAVTRAGLAFTVDCPPLGEPVHIDREMWEKVVLNLLSNALKFTFEGGIGVRLRAVDGAAELTVTDTGTGIPAEELPRLFERFHRISDARGRSGEGSGIGLAMVRELVGLHGGTVSADSTPDVGTTFTVRLPMGSAHLPADRLAAPEPVAAAGSATPYVTEALRWLPPVDGDSGAGPAPVPSRSGRVLVADDNADMREYLLRLLQPHYAVRPAPDGQAALAAALADPPDLVLSDVMMPGLDGMQLLAALRADDRTSRVPVLLLSARAGEEAAVEGLAAGADDYLVKPFSAQELLARVGAHLHLGRARREAEERFTAMADLAPALIWVADRAGERTFVNRGWTQFTGRSLADELGRRWVDQLHPQDRRRYEETVAEATADRRGWEVEFRLRRADGTFHWLLEHAAPIGTGQAFTGHVGSCTDITTRYRETERQTLLAEVGAALDREPVVDEQLSQLARIAVERRLADVVTVRLVAADGTLRFAGIAGTDPGAAEALRDVDPYGGLGGEVARTGRSSLAPEIAPPGGGPGRAVASPDDDRPAATLGVRSALAVPLTVRGRVRAVLSMGRRGDAPPFTEDDQALAEEIAARAALALDNALLLADERAAAHRLTLLQRATAELSAATTPLDVAVAAAGHLRQLTGEVSRVAVFELDPSHRALAALFFDGGGGAETERLWSTVPLSARLPITTAVNERRPVWLSDLAVAPDAYQRMPAELDDAMRAFGLAAVVALPLAVAGRVVGVISIAFPEPTSFSPTERAMLLAVAEQCAQALDRARLYRSEQGIAETLQLSLLPAQLPRLERLALAASYLPGAEGSQAGGDWYDVVELDGDRVAIAVGDVVGQGPAAAAVMGQLRSALSAALLQGSPPAAALELLDRFAARLPGALASTAACLVLDWTAGTLHWARAGHPAPVLVGEEGARLLDDDGGGAVLGAPDRAPYREGTAGLRPGGTLLLYTDGLVERRDELLDTGLARLREVTERYRDADPRGLIGRLLAEMLADTGQPDDVAVIAARLLPGPLHGTVPADPARLAGVRRRVLAWAGASALPADVVDDLQLALGEAMANAVEHAYAGEGPGECEYRVARDADGGVTVTVRDDGTWRPPPEDRGFRGRGLEMISALGSDVRIGPTAEDGSRRGTTVSFRLAAGPRKVGAVPPSAPPSPMAVEVEAARLAVREDGDGLRFEVAGELDLSSAPSVGAELIARLADVPAGSAVTVDLRRASYLSSAGIGMVLQARAAARERGITLTVRTSPGGAAARMLDVSGLTEELATTPL